MNWGLMNSYNNWAESIQSQVYDYLHTQLEKKLSSHNNTLSKALSYVISNPGRALRPQMLFSAQLAISECEYFPLELAGSVELIHITSLIYDDLPCMDDGITRRGRPCVHKIFGEDIAILAADSLKSMAFEQFSMPNLLAHINNMPILLSHISQASGYSGICLGQAMDLGSVSTDITEDGILEMYFLKTVKLIETAAFLGAWSNPDMSESFWDPLSKITINLGIAFQIVNDLRDGLSVEETGKIPDQDLKQDKSTLLSYHDHHVCARIATDLLDKSKLETNLLPGDSTRLCQIIEWVLRQIPVDFLS